MLEFALPLTFDTDQVTELGPEDEAVPSPPILTHHTFWRATLKSEARTILLATFDGKPACLIVLRFAFQWDDISSRIQHASISLNFEDAPEIGRQDPRHYPRVLRMRPKGTYYGRGAMITHQRNTGFGVGVEGTTAGFHVKRRVVGEERVSVSGEESLKAGFTYPTRLKFIFSECGTTYGIPPACMVAVVVGYVPGRRWCAKVKVNAKVGFGLGAVKMPFWGGQGKTIYFEDAKKLAKVSGGGEVELDCETDRDLAKEDLEQHTGVIPPLSVVSEP